MTTPSTKIWTANSNSLRRAQWYEPYTLIKESNKIGIGIKIWTQDDVFGRLEKQIAELEEITANDFDTLLEV